MDNQIILKKYQSFEHARQAYELLRDSGIGSNFKEISGYDLTRLNPFKMKLQHPSWLLSVDIHNKEKAEETLKSFHVNIIKRRIPTITIRVFVIITIVIAVFEMNKETLNLGEDLNTELHNIIPFINVSTTMLLFALYIVFEVGIFTMKKFSSRARIYLNNNSYQMRVFFLYFLVFIWIMLYII